jgi:hypothetical protein
LPKPAALLTGDARSGAIDAIRAACPPASPRRPKRIGFLFNHDQIHQVAHSLPIALALAAMDGAFDVIVASTTPALRREILRIAGARIGRITCVDLSLTSIGSRMLNGVLGPFLPSHKVLIYRDNIEFFRTLDVLVVSERTSLLLRTRYGLDQPLLVLADHGAGDRAIGFNGKTAQFDHVLAAGPKIRDRLIAEAGLDADRLSITGYPKFDIPPGLSPCAAMQANGRPTVLYNPHVSPHLSSWFSTGRQVLDYFLASDRYNLIFAPHVMLFQRRWALSIDRLRLARPGTIAAKYRDAPNIHIDTGSVCSTDMSYTAAADIYLGDVSSQIYEFLRTPRPCVFLNVHAIDASGDVNYAHWQAGPVCTGIDGLDSALEQAVSGYEAVYRPIQKKLFDYTFDLTTQPSAQRAAHKLLQLAECDGG